MKNNLTTYILIGFTLILAVTAVILGQRIYQLRNEPIAPNVPKSKPKAADNPNPSAACTLTFNIQVGPTSTPTPTGTPGPTSTPGPSSTPTPGPTSTPGPNPGCDQSCDVNNNKCSSDAPYCVDFAGDGKGPVCGRQNLASEGPKCENPQPGCGSGCDVNNNRCVSDAPYCIDYSTDSTGAVCGRSQVASNGPQCNPTPTPVEIPQVGVLDKTIWGLLGGAAMIILGLLFL